jgi:hypothetical protein
MDDPHKPDFNPYQPGVDAHLPDRVATLAPGQTDPRAIRSVILASIAAFLYWLPPGAIVLGIIAMLQARSFMNDWQAMPRIRGRGAARAGWAVGIGSIAMAVFMGLYYLWIYFQVSKTQVPPALPY